MAFVFVITILWLGAVLLSAGRPDATEAAPLHPHPTAPPGERDTSRVRPVTACPDLYWSALDDHQVARLLAESAPGATTELDLR